MGQGLYSMLLWGTTQCIEDPVDWSGEFEWTPFDWEKALKRVTEGRITSRHISHLYYFGIPLAVSDEWVQKKLSAPLAFYCALPVADLSSLVEPYVPEAQQLWQRATEYVCQTYHKVLPPAELLIVFDYD